METTDLEQAETTETTRESGDADADDRDAKRLAYLERKITSLEKKLAKDDDEDDEPKVTQSPDDDELDFKIYHAEEIKLCQDEFKSYRSKGYEAPDALRLAKLDKGIKEPTRNTQRQAAEGSDAGVQNRTSTPEVKMSDDFVRDVGGGDPEKAKALKEKYQHMVRPVGRQL